MAIDQLGYRPNVLARQLVQQRTSILGVVVGDLANPFFAEMAKSVERHAAARGYTAMFCNTEGESESELAGVETLLEHRVAGIVFLAFSGAARTRQAVLQHQVPAGSCGQGMGPGWRGRGSPGASATGSPRISRSSASTTCPWRVWPASV